MRRGVTVCQLGARMHYAVPRLLHRAGFLEKFQTDICAQKGWPRLLAMIPARWQPAGVRRLAGRVVTGVPASRITAFTAFGMEYSRRRNATQNPEQMTATYLWAGQEFGRLVLQRGLGAAAGVYTFNTAGSEILQYARAHGLRTATEQTIAPQERELALMAHEQELHPHWEPALALGPSALALARRERAEWDAADVILCGSEFVRAQIALCGGPRERCVIVPYGVDGSFGIPERPPHGGPLRVLTVGAIGLRKGSPYVLAAARQLRGTAVFRMVGAVSISDPARQELSAEVELTGVVPRSEIARHFAWADVFLLPSICEGSATVTYEALAAGLPVIATPNTGSVVRDGVDGFVIPCGQAEAIVEKIAQLASSRELLHTLARHARERAGEFTLEAYGQRLLRALAPLLADTHG